ncbi:MAG TPA: hypothetical protein VME47_02480 [Acetobacteraceae bacterium]|nr:hypothetical protein [Acetobacteraceae bacterium]
MQFLREQMAEDSRRAISAIARSEPIYKGLETSFEYERSVHFIITLSIFTIFSLYVAQTECTNNLLKGTLATWIEMAALGIFAVVFVIRVVRRGFDLAAVHAARPWERASLVAFLVAIITEIVLHLACSSA